MAYSWPVPLNSPITQYFAANPYSPVQPAGHTGMDFGIPVGTNITAIGAGTVLWADWATKLSPSNPWYINPAYAGIVVLINHGNIISCYAHLDSTPLNIGDRVTQGQVIAKSGNTGLSSGPHLHFEIFPNPITGIVNWLANRLNPLDYITKTTPAPAPAPVPLKPNQRRVGAANVNLRDAPSVSGKILRIIKANTVEEFSGYVTGERVNNKNLWYKDSQGYAHCDGFTTQVTTGLTNQTPPPPVPATWRKTGSAVGKVRKEPKLNATELSETKPHTNYDILNWTTGDTFEGTDIWFQVKGSTGWIHSKLFTSQSTTALNKVVIAPPAPPPAPVPEPTKPPAPTPSEKTVVSVGVRVREYPSVSSVSTVKYVLPAGSTIKVSGYVTSEVVENSAIWFELDGDYIHSSGVTDASIEGLTKKPTPTLPGNTGEGAYSFTPDFDFVEYKPANTHNMQHGNFPANPEKIVIHQFDAIAKNPSIEGVISWFQTDRRPTGQSSAHFVVSGSRIVQMVSLKDRAFHAGSIGNAYIGIEVDPDEDVATVSSVKRLIAALNKKYNKTFTYTEHKDVPGNATECGVDIHLEKYALEAPTPPTPPVVPVPVPVEPVPVPVPVEPNIEPDAPTKEQIAFVLDYLIRQVSKP